jgi:hypothetical protein
MTLTAILFPSVLERHLTNKRIFVLISLILVPILADTSITRISAYTGSLGSVMDQILVFGLIFICSVIGQYLLFCFLWSRIRTIARGQMALLLKPTLAASLSCMAIITYLILQMLLFESYSTLGFKSVVWISFAISAFLLGYISYRFFIWATRKRNYVVVAYTIALAALSFNCMFSIAYVTHQMSLLNPLSVNKDVIEPSGPSIGYVGGLSNMVNSLYQITLIIAFSTTWLATALLLYHYIGKHNPIKYCIIIGLPLLYFLGQFPMFPSFFLSFGAQDPIFFGLTFTLLFNASKPIGGVFFGVALYSTCKSIKKDEVRDYVLLSSLGMILLFASNQPIALTLMSFPPFGLITISILGIASYLLVLGIYTASVSVANDTELIRFMKKSVRKEYQLLQSIGQAHREEIQLEQIKTRVLRLTDDLKDEIAEESGVQPSIQPQDLNEYIEKVLKEVKKK